MIKMLYFFRQMRYTFTFLILNFYFERVVMYPYSILYAEDDKGTQKIFSEILSDYFSHIKSAKNGAQAIESFDAENFDIVITDINMPQTDGLALARHVKNKSPHTPILIISAYSEYHMLSNAIDIGVDGYILKPIKVDQLLSQLQKIVEKLNLIKNAKRHESLLREYKEAIDRSSIVSKTNTKGIITYVNDAFCAISQYSAEELLGRPHSIIRHPDMPSSAFEQMWRTISSKQPWDGVVKNRKKDGSAYYVRSIVNPILNEHGEIEEYIAIRQDVTERETYRQDLENRLQESIEEVIQTQREIVYTMGTIGEKRSKETGLHVKRVAHCSYILAKLYGLDEKEAQLLEQGSPMHDIGKVGIPDSVLHKPGPLNEEEWAIIKTHPTLGYEMLKHSKREILQAAAIIAHEHHERWDGKGYPRGLRGEEIHIFGRITAIADVYDALGHDRVYKKAWSLEQIQTFFEEEKGHQFDPVLTTLFLKNIKHFETLKADFSHTKLTGF